MGPIIVNGEAWRVVRAAPGDPSLIDGLGVLRLATADPASKTVSISSSVAPPLLDRVLLHETAHAAMESHGVSSLLRDLMPDDLWFFVDEVLAQLIEEHAIEIALAASRSLGRPLCVKGACLG